MRMIGSGLGWVVAVGVAVGWVGVARGQVTRVATFENYTAWTSYSVGFTEPASGIYFHDSTHPPNGGFDVDRSFGVVWSPGYYLTSGGGPEVYGSFFAFTADLPAAADRVGMDVMYLGAPASNFQLKGYDAAGVVVAQQSGPAVNTQPFHIEISSPSYDIVRIQTFVQGGAVGYDNISYTVLPEPGVALGGVAVGGVVLGRRRGR
jgi:hypothetical protein